MISILTLFGTRPEAIKLAPVIWAIENRSQQWRGITVCSSQHTDLLRPFVAELDIRIDYDLKVMSAAQSPTMVLTRVIQGLQGIFDQEQPDLVLVQGDTTTALAGALAASYAGIAVGHVEAGLRTGNRRSPFPEEINRRLIGQITELHFTATRRNMRALIDEGIASDAITNTGNPVIDSLNHILGTAKPSPDLAQLLAQLHDKRIMVLTTHRRENFGEIMRGHMKAVRAFCDAHSDVAVVFPVHPNPQVRLAAREELADHAQIHLTPPCEYTDFIHLLSKAWLIASDSGGIVEEAPTMGKPVLVLRESTERMEAIECGSARIVGTSGDRLREMLEQAIASDEWSKAARRVINPFGSGDAGERIAVAIEQYLSGDANRGTNKELPWRDDENHADAASL